MSSGPIGASRCNRIGPVSIPSVRPEDRHARAGFPTNELPGNRAPAAVAGQERGMKTDGRPAGELEQRLGHDLGDVGVTARSASAPANTCRASGRLERLELMHKAVPRSTAADLTRIEVVTPIGRTNHTAIACLAASSPREPWPQTPLARSTGCAWRGKVPQCPVPVKTWFGTLATPHMSLKLLFSQGNRGPHEPGRSPLTTG